MFSNVSITCLPEKTHSHIGCIRFTFPLCAFSNVLSIDLLKRLDTRAGNLFKWLLPSECRASTASPDILPIYFKTPYFFSGPYVDSLPWWISGSSLSSLIVVMLSLPSFIPNWMQNKVLVWALESKSERSKLRHSVRMRAQVSSKVGWKWKWPNYVGKNHMSTL